ncbi:MAG: type 4a pilus biogenesis protein PilO [Candidatus Omnitrophica bacterium]|nr:type 4a pilus biogenesis protein PilO [Candidatus Omnitrophota bacterium]
MDRKKIEVLALAGLLVLIACVLVFQVVIAPRRAAQRAAAAYAGAGVTVTSSLSSLRSQVQAARAQVSQITRLESEVSSMEAVLKELEARLMDPNEIPVFLDQLSGLAEQSGVEIVRVQPVSETPSGPEEEAPVYRQFPVAVEALGSFEGLTQFVSRLETQQRIMRVTNLRIQGADDTPTKHRVRMVVSAYMQEVRAE